MLTNDVVTFPDRVEPIRLEVRTGIRVANLALPVHREVRCTNVLWIVRSHMLHPVMDELECFGEVWMIFP